jgi:hypothetical protein
MPDNQSTEARWSIPTVVDLLAKAIAVLVAASLLVGTTYNIAFFLVTKPEWLFHLSVADNVTATFFSLPIVTALSTGVLVMMGLAVVRPLRPFKTLDRKTVLVGGAAYAVIVAVISVATVASGHENAVAVWVTATLFITAMLGPLLTNYLPENRTLRSAWLSGLLIVSLMTATVALALATAHRLGEVVQIEAADGGGMRSIVVGKTVRILDGGVILQQSGAGWVWFPKEQIRRITEATDARP